MGIAKCDDMRKLTSIQDVAAFVDMFLRLSDKLAIFLLFSFFNNEPFHLTEKPLDVGVFHLMYFNENILLKQKFALVIDDSRCIKAANALVLFN